MRYLTHLSFSLFHPRTHTQGHPMRMSFPLYVRRVLVASFTFAPAISSNFSLLSSRRSFMLSRELYEPHRRNSIEKISETSSVEPSSSSGQVKTQTKRKEAPTKQASFTASPRPYKSTHSRSKGARPLKIRPAAPWGLRQLRDSWSADAMTSLPTENMSERTHREYRYHPEEFRRYYLKYAAFLTVPCIILGASCSYYYHTGQPIWKGDPQEILNYIRSADTSPRSALYAFQMRESDRLPDHILSYRELHRAERVDREERFSVAHTTFRRLTEQEERILQKLREEDADDNYFASGEVSG